MEPALVLVETPQDLLGLLVFLLYIANCRPDEFEALSVTLVGRIAMFIFPSAVMLYLFARVLDFGQSEGRGRAFQEVPERAELVKVVAGSV